MKKFIVTAAIAFAFVLSGGIADAAFTWTSGQSLLRVGSRGPQVLDLQICLAALDNNPDSNIDGIFGNITKSAVMSFQAENGLMVDGIIGNQTGPYFEEACDLEADVDEDDVDMDDDNDISDFDVNDGEEADFSDFDLDDADDDTIEEGEDEAELAEYVFELEDEGAALLERMDVVLTFSGTDNGDETDPWEIFNNIYLMVDGDVIAEVEGDDDDEWEDTTVDGTNYDEARLRITNINHVFDADEEHTIVLAADIAGSVDLGSDDVSEWTVRISNTGMRFVDEAGITVYLAEEAGDDSDTAVFTIEEEGQDDELDVQSSNDDPESATLKVEDDEASDDYTVFIFELEADEDSSDIELEDVGVRTVVTGGDFDEIVKDQWIEIDGEEFDDVDIEYYTDATFVTGTVSNAPSAFALLVFDIDKDFTVDSGDTVDVELMLEFRSANGVNYSPGATVQGSVEGAEVTGEGADDLVADGSATGDVHTLLVEGIDAETTSTSKNVVVVEGGASDDYAEFEIELDVMAFEEDAFISEIAVDAVSFTIVNASTGADVVSYTADTTTGGTLPAGVTTLGIDSGADLQSGFYRINEGDTENLTLNVTYNPAAAGSFRLRLDGIQFNDSASLTGATTYATIPAQDYRTGNANVTE